MLCNKTFRCRHWYLAGVALVAAFVGGWVAAGTQYATTVNKGLVTAFNSVGQNLFGSAVFSAHPPNPIIPGDPLRLFIADDSKLPVAIDIFHPPNPIAPPNPCRVTAQLSVGADGDVRLAIDSNAFPDGITIDYDMDLARLRPNVERCPASLPAVDF